MVTFERLSKLRKNPIKQSLFNEIFVCNKRASVKPCISIPTKYNLH